MMLVLTSKGKSEMDERETETIEQSEWRRETEIELRDRELNRS